MIGERAVTEILAQYEKHGWNLRRVLLSAEMESDLPATLFGQAEIFRSELNALWFARASFEGGEAWELRRLSDAPFALVEVFAAETGEAAREAARNAMQTRMAEQASKFGNKKVT